MTRSADRQAGSSDRINPTRDLAEPHVGAARRSEECSESPGKIITGLHELPPSALLDETALANKLGVSKRTVRRMVVRYELPPPVRFAGRSVWQAGKLVAWVEARVERALRAAERDAKRLERLG